MLVRHARKAVVVSLLLSALAPAAGAVTLWDQSNWDTNGEGSVNLSSTSCNFINGNTKVHTASDVHFTQTVNITSISVYETDGNAASATQAYLWIAPKTGAMPTENSSLVNNAANLVTISSAYEFNGSEAALVVTASGLNISLPAGNYWVSLTPKHSLGFFPYSIHRVISTGVVGDPTAAIEACTSNANWFHPLDPSLYDYAIKIEGNLPVPTHTTSWGRVKSIYR
jgi:hypothetical protein